MELTSWLHQCAALPVNSDSSKRSKSGMEEFLFMKGWKRNYCSIAEISGGILASSILYR
jgi:hypothetical protein